MSPEAVVGTRPPGIGTAEDPIRFAVFTTHPIQYQVPLFRALARRPQLEPTVYFGSRHGLEGTYDSGFGRVIAWDIPLVEGYHHVFLENRAWRPDVGRFWGVNVPGIAAELTPDRFDAVVVLGWNTFGHLQAIRAARAAGLPVVLRGESTLAMLPAGRVRAAVRSAVWLPLRRPIYRRALASVSAVVATGTRNAEYFEYFGVRRERIFRGLYCVENERFALPEPERGQARRRVRQIIGAGESEVVFLVAGKLTAGKRPLDVLSALARLSPESLRVRLVYLGDGPLRPRLEHEAARLGLDAAVHVSGFVNQAEIPDWYAAADCLVHPSRSETWGLVVNEAMAAGLPVIASDATGCVPDLVRSGENGAIYPVGSVGDLADRLRAVLALPREERLALGGGSRAMVANATFEHVVDALIAALRFACDGAAGRYRNRSS